MIDVDSSQYLQKLWVQTLTVLQKTYPISETAIDMFISKLTLRSIDNGIVVMDIGTAVEKNIIEQQFAERLRDSFSKVLGFDVKLRIISKETSPAPSPSQSPSPDPDDFNDDYFFHINAGASDYFFEDFVIGENNHLSYAACLNVAKLSPNSKNPLFIYGGSGLGKTHLLYSIRNKIMKDNDLLHRDPPIKVMYTDCEKMTSDFVEAIKEGTMKSFKEYYRNADILLVDDIQFLARKTQTQEEFFHTFKELHENGKQIVLTSDRPPKEIATLEDRLRSRFEQGLITDIQSPELETRIAIIKRKAEKLHMTISDDVCEYIAQKLKSNVRQLEGAVNNMQAQYMLTGNPPSIHVAHIAIRDILDNDQQNPITTDKIIEEVSRTLGISVNDILSQSQTSSTTRARQVAMFITRSITGKKQKEIGDDFGKDHTTVIYAIRKVDSLMKKDPSFKNTVNDIIRNLTSQ